MKFNEKLIELRKKEGLSQEELGYKLNVTRQTVSKWELGQKTPDMDKLVEMSKIFNVSVDELINESDVQTNPNPIIEDQSIVKEGNKEKNIKIIIVGALIIVILLIVVKFFTGFSSIFNKGTNTIDQATEVQENILDKFFDIFDKATNTIDQGTETQDESEIKDIKRKIGTFDNYEVTFKYDADGFINKAIIEKL